MQLDGHQTFVNKSGIEENNEANEKLLKNHHACIHIQHSLHCKELRNLEICHASITSDKRPPSITHLPMGVNYQKKFAADISTHESNPDTVSEKPATNERSRLI